MSLFDAVANLFGTNNNEHGDFVVAHLPGGGFVQAAACNGQGVVEVSRDAHNEKTDDMGFKANGCGTFAKDVNCKSMADAEFVAKVVVELAGDAQYDVGFFDS